MRTVLTRSGFEVEAVKPEHAALTIDEMVSLGLSLRVTCYPCDIRVKVDPAALEARFPGNATLEQIMDRAKCGVCQCDQVTGWAAED